MATISRYVLRDANDQEIDTRVWEQDEYAEARQAALDAHAMLIELEFEYSDSTLVHNFLDLPDGCTGDVSQMVGGIQHYGRSCPIHDERTT